MKRLHEIRNEKNLGTIIGGNWGGWTWHEGRIYAPGGREGLGPDDLRALPYLHSIVKEYRRANWNYETEMARMRNKVDLVNKNAAYYRNQLQIAGKLGIVLQRIAG